MTSRTSRPLLVMLDDEQLAQVVGAICTHPDANGPAASVALALLPGSSPLLIIELDRRTWDGFAL